MYIHPPSPLPLPLAAPASSHLGMRQEGENMHLPSCRIDITDRRAKKLTGVNLRAEIHDAIAATGAYREYFGDDASYRYVVRRQGGKGGALEKKMMWGVGRAKLASERM